MRQSDRKTKNAALAARLLGETNLQHSILNPLAKHDERALARAVRQRIDAGDVSGAAKLVIGESRVVPPDEHSAKQLSEKQPQAKEEVMSTCFLPAHIVLSKRQISEAALSMNCASAPGPDGLRPSHVHQFLGESAGDEREAVANELHAFAEVCTAGRIPDTIKPFVFGATLCALRKNDNSLRPIAVGNVLRRLISKAISTLLRERAATLLSPNQLGVGISGGSGNCSSFTSLLPLSLCRGRRTHQVRFP